MEEGGRRESDTLGGRNRYSSRREEVGRHLWWREPETLGERRK